MMAWARFLGLRVIAMLLVLWSALSFVFVMAYWLPSDPARAAVGPHADLATVERVRALMCLDKPFWSQYGCYVGRIGHLDLGTSFRTGRPVADILLSRLGPTAELAFSSMAAVLLVSLPISFFLARSKRRQLELATAVASTAVMALPPFVVGPVLAIVFSHRFHLLPGSGAGVEGLDRLVHLILPTLTLMIFGVATYVRLWGDELRSAAKMPYLRTALAKGSTPNRALAVHAFPNALGPIIAWMAVDLGALLSGAVTVEYVFAWPGLGREMMLAVLELDLPVVLGAVVFSSVLVVATNFLADIVRALLHPQLRPR